jgi:hypothetical protein
MENPTQPGLIGITNLPENLSSDTVFYSEGEFVFNEWPYFLKCISGNGHVSFDTGIEVTLSDNQFSVRYTTPPTGWKTTDFELNAVEGSQSNLDSFMIKKFKACHQANQVFGGIGTVDIRPSLKSYQWFPTKNPTIYMSWDQNKLTILSPQDPATCS